MSKLADLRHTAGLTQKQLAVLVGVPQQWVAKIESGVTDIGNITLSKAIKVADALGVDVRELLTND